MGIIILGILISAGLLFLSNLSEEAMALLIVFVLITAISIGLLVPTGGTLPFEEAKIQNLHSLKNELTIKGNGSPLYVNISTNNTYLFYAETDSEFANENSKAYVSRSLAGNNVTVVEEDNCEQPRLVEYYRDNVPTFWTYGINARETKYVFYVPVGTIAHDLTLH